jgi:hypothetical protein
LNFSPFISTSEWLTIVGHATARRFDSNSHFHDTTIGISSFSQEERQCCFLFSTIFSRNFRQVNVVPLLAQRCQSVTMAQIQPQQIQIEFYLTFSALLLSAEVGDVVVVCVFLLLLLFDCPRAVAV